MFPVGSLQQISSRLAECMQLLAASPVSALLHSCVQASFKCSYAFDGLEPKAFAAAILHEWQLLMLLVLWH